MPLELFYLSQQATRVVRLKVKKAQKRYRIAIFFYSVMQKYNFNGVHLDFFLTIKQHSDFEDAKTNTGRKLQ